MMDRSLRHKNASEQTNWPELGSAVTTVLHNSSATAFLAGKPE